MRALCLDHLSLYDVTALELIEVAARLECDAVSLFVTPGPLGPYLDLTRDRAARADVLAALRDTGLAVGVVEPFMLEADTDWNLLERSVALAAQMQGTVNALCFDDEPARLQQSFGRLAQMCRTEGVRMVVEGFTLSSVRTLADALAIADTVGPEIGLTVDTLHIMRTGGSWTDVSALPPERVVHVQINDGPRAAPSDLLKEATVARQVPGEGEFDLAGVLPRVPAAARLAVEAPFPAAPDMSPLERARTIVEASRALLP